MNQAPRAPLIKTMCSRKTFASAEPLSTLILGLSLGGVSCPVLLNVVFLVRHRLRQIHHRQHYEYEGLHQGYEDSKHYGEDRNEPWRQPQKGRRDRVVGELIDK